MKYYTSPRWSGEIADCSMPMTFDTYSLCSYRCLYCFSFFQRSIGLANKKKSYLANQVSHVNPAAVRRIFEEPETSMFGPYVKSRIAMQWGGLSDQFDEYEREAGVTLELLRFFREIEYPISFSTKATWWTEDERYVELFKGADHFNLKFSLLTLDEEKAHKVEVLVPTPEERLQAIERAATWGVGGVTLRFRPFIIGVSTPSYINLVRRAADAGAEAVSTEFLCIDTRSVRAKRRFEAISRTAGYDVVKMYKATDKKHGYLRGNRELKRPYFEAMYEECEKLGLRFYVSDADFKEYCANGSCCGLRPDWNYSRGQFTEALLIAEYQGQVSWSDIEGSMTHLIDVPFGGNINTPHPTETRASFHHYDLRKYLRYLWNDVNGAKSPYKYFGGVLQPVGKDEQGDVIYEYQGDDAGIHSDQGA